MKHKSFDDADCPIARSLEHVGEWWNILIIRDALNGASRFDEFQKSLGIAPNILTRRLNGLVASGLFERRRYSDRPPRLEYVLTPRGREFRMVTQALLAWGNRHFPPTTHNVTMVNTETEQAAEPLLIDRVTGRPLTDPVFRARSTPIVEQRGNSRHTPSS